MDYIELPLTADATALSDIGKEYLAEEIDGWEARPGNVESVLLEADGQIAAEVIDQAASVPPVIFAYFGQWLLGITLYEATPATATVSISFDVGALTTVPAGSLFAVPNPDGESYVFATDEDLRSDAADKTVTATALEAGAEANGCSGVGEWLDVTDGVTGVTMTTVAGGGADEEEADAYLDRLAEALTILAPRPILPQDHATMARQVPGVGRAVAIDLYQPSNTEGGYGTPRDGASHTPVERCVTTAITGPDGAAPSDALMLQTFNVLDAAREVNFLVYVIPPTYVSIDVRATVVAYPGYVLSEVEDAAAAMMSSWLDPSSWGSEAIGEVESWARDTKARIYEAVDFLNRADGVHYVVSVEIKKTADSVWSNADIALDGTAPLPMLGTADITANPSS